MINTTRQPLDKALRRSLEATVIKARDVAEQAATQALKRLGVGDAKAADYLSEAQRKLRTRLRARGRQLGDIKSDNGQQTTHKLITEVAYEHWHRMLFARFLEQNNLLMYDEHTALTLAECSELAQDSDTARDELERRCETGWELAGVLASKMLPQIFRIDSPVFELEFAPEHQRSLEQLVTALKTETFQAQDSLGWVYQFWQSKRKEEVNASEVKIGADELAPVTQLFTEPYMVSFLLDNALGAWWAGQRLNESDWQNAQSEQELREKAAIPGAPLEYLRFVKCEQSGRWTPAAGTFSDWPQNLAELQTLDPSCGSGHFLVAALLMLVPMRMELEGLTEREAVDAVLRDNLHGLELDQRCVELAAFALAFAAWTYPNAGGYRPLPELQLACSGLSVKAAKDEWKQLGLNKRNLAIALDWLHDSFADAPVLGSLLNPAKSSAAKLVQWQELSGALGQALEQEDAQPADSSNQLEAAVVAQGIAKAATLLIKKYHWVVTNVPYLARGKQDEVLRNFCDQHYPEAKNDLATVFLQRCLEFCQIGGTTSIVLPQNWLFLTSYRKFREKLLKQDLWHLIARLGPKGFQTPMWDFNVQLITLSRGQPQGQHQDLLGGESKGQLLRGLDVSELKTAAEKAEGLITAEVKTVEQAQQLKNPDARIALSSNESDTSLLVKYCDAVQGLATHDDPRFGVLFWEIGKILKPWEGLSWSVEKSQFFGGSQRVFYNDDKEPNGLYYKHAMALKAEGRLGGWKSGTEAWNKNGISIRVVGHLPCSLYMGSKFDQTIASLVPKQAVHLPAIWSFCSSEEYNEAVREIDQALKVTNSTLVKVPFDLERWTAVAEEKYPHGLPKPYSSDPAQWIFHGHPAGSVIWCKDAKRTIEGELRADDTVLQVAVARLLGYQWPAELDADMELAPEQRAWVERCQELKSFVDDDGIVCLPAVRGEKAADQRLEALLEAAYGDAWTTPLKNRLLDAVGSKSLSLWLRDKFFEQHCKLFQHRPFIWHIWDGLKDGFSVLVNYHKLDKAGLERLIYTYLGDWIRTQQAGLANGEDGAQERLAAAEALKKELEAILEGEKPYDIFVRWKPLAEQPIGWTPDLNDGVRLNIRPFLKARDVGKKDAGILRWKPNIHWKKDRGADVESAPWYNLGLEYDGKQGDRINEHHLTLEDKRVAKLD